MRFMKCQFLLIDFMVENTPFRWCAIEEKVMIDEKDIEMNGLYQSIHFARYAATLAVLLLVAGIGFVFMPALKTTFAALMILLGTAGLISYGLSQFFFYRYKKANRFQ